MSTELHFEQSAQHASNELLIQAAIYVQLQNYRVKAYTRFMLSIQFNCVRLMGFSSLFFCSLHLCYEQFKESTFILLHHFSTFIRFIREQNVYKLGNNINTISRVCRNGNNTENRVHMKVTTARSVYVCVCVTIQQHFYCHHRQWNIIYNSLVN